MSRRLDRARPYGEVIGEAGYRFEQDGTRFDDQENEIVTAKPRAGKPAVAASSTPAPGADKPVEPIDQVAAQLLD
jgi:hypothetical protein